MFNDKITSLIYCRTQTRRSIAGTRDQAVLQPFLTHHQHGVISWVSFRRHDSVSGRVYCQMQLALGSPLLGAVFSDLPLAFTKRFQAGQIDNQIGDVSL